MKKWFIPNNYSLAIKCELEEEKKTNPTEFQFYWIDEPLGYSLTEDEFFNTKEEALEYLKNQKEKLPIFPISLNYWRNKRIKFLKDINGKDWIPPKYKDKKENEEWITI